MISNINGGEEKILSWIYFDLHLYEHIGMTLSNHSSVCLSATFWRFLRIYDKSLIGLLSNSVD